MEGFSFSKAFLPSTPLIETFVRGTIVYLFIFILLRLVLKRQSSSVSMNDLLVLVLIADAAQNAMAGQYTSISDGLVLVATIIFWSFFVDWLGFHFTFFRRFTEPPPLLLVKDGKMLRQNMKKELVTPGELESQLREQGIEDLSLVKEAFIEADGNISVITWEQHAKGKRSGREKRL